MKYISLLGSTDVVPLVTGIELKADARRIETRHITTYEKLFGFKPGFIGFDGTFVPIQKSTH